MLPLCIHTGRNTADLMGGTSRRPIQVTVGQCLDGCAAYGHVVVLAAIFEAPVLHAVRSELAMPLR